MKWFVSGYGFTGCGKIREYMDHRGRAALQQLALGEAERAA